MVFFFDDPVTLKGFKEQIPHKTAGNSSVVVVQGGRIRADRYKWSYGVPINGRQ